MSEPWEKKIAMLDPHGTVVALGFSPAEDDLPAGGSVQVRTGGASIYCSAAPESLRQLAAAALDVADAIDEAAT